MLIGGGGWIVCRLVFEDRKGVRLVKVNALQAAVWSGTRRKRKNRRH